MSMLLNTAAAAAAITVGAGLLAARAQENVNPVDVTCAEIVGLGRAQTERVLYFLAGLNEARILAARQGAQPETPADAMPAHSVSVDPDTNIDPLARRGSAPDDARVSFDQAAGDRMESSEKLPRDAMSWPSPNIDWSDHIGDGQSQTVEARREAEGRMRGEEVRARVQAMAAARNAESGNVETVSEPALSAVDTTVTGAVGSAGLAALGDAGFYRIPVEMVMTDCRDTPGARLADVVNQYRR